MEDQIFQNPPREPDACIRNGSVSWALAGMRDRAVVAEAGIVGVALRRWAGVSGVDRDLRGSRFDVFDCVMVANVQFPPARTVARGQLSFIIWGFHSYADLFLRCFVCWRLAGWLAEARWGRWRFLAFSFCLGHSFGAVVYARVLMIRSGWSCEPIPSVRGVAELVAIPFVMWFASWFSGQGLNSNIARFHWIARAVMGLQADGACSLDAGTQWLAELLGFVWAGFCALLCLLRRRWGKLRGPYRATALRYGCEGRKGGPVP